MNKIENNYGEYQIIGHWSDDFGKQCDLKKVKKLILNTAKGWKGDNLDFLKEFKNLEDLKILDWDLKNINGIYFSKNLLKLQLEIASKQTIDFSFFEKLVDLRIDWELKSESLFNCINLEYLFINKFNIKFSAEFKTLVKLKNLLLYSSNFESVEFLRYCENLSELVIANNRKLNDLSALKSLKNLKELHIEGSRNIEQLSEVFKCKSLESLMVPNCGKINTIKGIENLQNLKEFIFYEDTNIMDGNLEPIGKLPHLEKIAFQNRKHYNKSWKDFEGLI